MRKGIGGAVATVLFGAGYFARDFLLDHLKKWLDAVGALDYLEAALSFLWDWALAHPLSVLVVMVLAIPAGVWVFIKWMSTYDPPAPPRPKLAGEPEDNLQQLGTRMLRMAERIRNSQGGFRNPFPDNIAHYRGAIDAIFVYAENAGYPTPGNAVFADGGYEALHEYLDFVGSHLSHGNFDAARQRAREVLDRIQNGAPGQIRTGVRPV